MISPTYGQLELKEVVNKIADYINKNVIMLSINLL